MSKTIEELLAPKPDARPRIYAYSIDDKAHAGLLKIGQTTRNVQQRVTEQLKTAAIKNYKIELDESAERDDGTIFLPIDSKTPSSSQNSRLMPFAGEHVTVTGKDYVRNGSHALVIDKISR